MLQADTAYSTMGLLWSYSITPVWQLQRRLHGRDNGIVWILYGASSIKIIWSSFGEVLLSIHKKRILLEFTCEALSVLDKPWQQGLYVITVGI